MWDYPFPLAIYPSTSTEGVEKGKYTQTQCSFSLAPSAELKLENSVNIFS